MAYNRRVRDYWHKPNQEIVTRYKEKILHYEDDFAVEQVNQIGCEIFVLRGFQDVAGQTPQQTRQNS